MDNQNQLANNPGFMRPIRISERIRSLQRQIDFYEKQVKNCEEGK